MTNGLVRSIVVMLTGLLLIFCSDSVVGWLIRIVGVAFFLPALVSAINIYITRAQGEMFPKVLITIIDVGSMAFGLWLMVAPASFEILFVKILALLLLLFAVYQVSVLAMAHRRRSIPVWMYIAPLLLVVASVVLFTSSFKPLETLSVVFGIAAVVSGVSDLIILLKLRKGKETSGTDVVKRF